MRVKTTVTMTAEYEMNPENYPNPDKDAMIMNDINFFKSDPVEFIDLPELKVDVRIEELGVQL